VAIYRTKISAAALKIQSAEGSENVPTLTADAVKFAGAPPTLTLQWSEDGDRSDAAAGTFGSDGRAIPAGAFGTIDLVMELHGRGSAYASIADLPSAALDAGLRISGFVKSFASGVQSYIDAESGLEVGTFHLWGGDGILYRLIDCVAKPKISLAANKPGIVTFSIEGTLAADPAPGAISGLVLPGVIPAPWTGSGAATALGTWTDATTAPNQLRASKVDLDIGNATTARPYAGANGRAATTIVDRQPELSLEVEAVALSTFDPFAEARAGKSPASTTPLFTTTIAGGVGNTIKIDTGVVALGFPGPLDKGGLAGWTLRGKIVRKTLAGGTAQVRLQFS
jgi:hypothetical protein